MLSEGMSMSQASKKIGVSNGVLIRWLIRTGKENQYAQACELRAFGYFEKITDIVEDLLAGRIDSYQAKVSGDMLKWVLSRMHPRVFASDTKELNVNVNSLLDFVQGLSKQRRELDITPNPKQIKHDE